MSEIRYGREFYTDQELELRRVDCAAGCGQRAERGSTYGNLLQNFECFHCGATWVGDRRDGHAVKFTNDVCEVA